MFRSFVLKKYLKDMGMELKDYHHDHKGCSHEEHRHGGMHVHPVVKNMKVALFLNVFFTIIEFIGGVFTNSVAIISDAIHDLGDSLAIAMALVLEKQSEKGRTKSYTYGTRRYSTLAALITSLILVIGSAVIVYQAVPRFFNPEKVHVSGVLWLAVLGLLFNGAAVLRLKKGGNSSLNQKAVMLHLMEDALGWLAVLIGGVIMYFTAWFWIDPLLSLGIAGFIMFNAIRNVAGSVTIFLQATPKKIDEKKIRTTLLSIPHVTDVHDIHIWTIDGEYSVFTSHIVVPPSSSSEVFNSVRHGALDILKKFHVQHPTIQVETSTDTCLLKNC